MEGIIQNPVPNIVKNNGYHQRKLLTDECFRTCARLNGGMNQNIENILYSPCGKACWDGIWNDTHANGLDYCQHKQFAPPLWLEQSFFAPAFEKLGDVKQAYRKCLMDCDEFGGNLKGECKENCLKDAQSVYTIKNKDYPHISNIERVESSSIEPKCGDECRDKLLPIYIIGGLVSVFFLIFIFLKLKNHQKRFTVK